MAAEKAPAFQFYVRDWRSSRKVQAMSFGQRGMYLEMLIEQWDKGAAPASAGACARTLGGSEGEWSRAWAALSVCFDPRKRDGLLVNAKLEGIRRKAKKFQKDQSLKGLAGAKKRWQGHSRGMARLEPAVAENSSASAIASASSSASAFAPAFAFAEEKHQKPTRAPRAPLVTDERFDRFWAVYPNKKAKDDALKAWQKRNPSEALAQIIIAAVERQKHWPAWTDAGGKYIPYPATWLNAGQWSDEPATAAVSRVSDIGRQNAANAEEALRIMEERDAVQR